MAYDMNLAARVRAYLARRPEYFVEEKKMFGGLAFLVNGKMCVNVSRKGLMCRFEPMLGPELEQKEGFLPMKMRGRIMQGYCYVESAGYDSNQDFDFWLRLCLDFNARAQASRK